MRRLCADLLHDWERGAGFAADLLDVATHRSGAAGRDRGQLQRLFFGVIRNQRLIDQTLSGLIDRSPAPKVRRLLRMGLTDLLVLGSAPHAVVNETVALAGSGKAFVNAVLRRAERGKEGIQASWQSLPPPIRWSVPDFLWERWTRSLGAAEALALARWDNEPAPVYVRIHPAPGSSLDLPPAEFQAVTGFPGFFRAGGALPHQWLEEGLAYVRDPSTQRAVDLLDVHSGMNVLDACAAPGGKTLAIVQAGADSDRLVATDQSPERLLRLERNLKRLRLGTVRVLQVDWLVPGSAASQQFPSFDRILVDAPCSNTGVIRRRIDVPWRLRPADFSVFPETQLALLKALSGHLVPGGKLVYSTCSVDSAENEQVIRTFLSEDRRFRLLAEDRVLPWIDGFDGAYAAALGFVAAR